MTGTNAPSEGLAFAGKLFGGFRLSHEIACGGMATVYLAHKTGPGGVGQVAAVKVIHPHLARDDEFVHMFLDEARIVACISHPNVCRVLDFGRDQGTYYLAMEYVFGETWADVLRRFKDSPEAKAKLPQLLAQVLAQACEGLHAAHEATDAEGRPLSIVHRDVSPQNILVGYDGTVRVLDFGIASAAERLHTTRNGTIKGRFAYMSPEQMRGRGLERRADVWSLGVVLWEGLSQSRLFKRDTEAETVLAVTSEAIPPPFGAAVPVPPSLRKVTARALARDLDERYPTAREMGLELTRFASSSVVPMGPAEVSLWMHKAFSDEIERKRGLMREAARASVESRRVSLVPPLPALEMGSNIAVDLEERDTNRLDRHAAPSISTVRTVQVQRGWSAPAKPLALVLAIALGGGAALWLPDQEAPHEAATAAEGASTSETSPGSMEASEPARGKARELDERVAAASGGSTPQKPAGEPASVAPQPPVEAPLELEAEAAQGEPKPAAEARATRRAARPARPAPRRPEPVAADPGTLNIVTPGGWAEIYERGRLLGTTPGQLVLAAGIHTLQIKPFGQGPTVTRRVRVRPNETTRLKIPLN